VRLHFWQVRLPSNYFFSSAYKSFAGLGFSEQDQQKPTKSFSGGWRFVLRVNNVHYLCPNCHDSRMRLALARALFVKVLFLIIYSVQGSQCLFHATAVFAPPR
jgi:predicted RNA-binding Zn-ribbon protein involved in translation (DUF1610 family)